MKKEPGFRRMVIKGIIRIFILLVLMFVAAGRLDYWQGWIFTGIMCVHIAISFVLFSDKPDLTRERLKPGPGMKRWDKIVMAFFGFFALATFILAVLDAGRFQWSTPFPLFGYIAACLFYCISVAFGLWAMYVNQFYSSVVRIQKDRGQFVIESGPYRFVRHPGYVGGILLFLLIPIVLGSKLALLPACVCMVLLIVRTYFEDKTLEKELPGYSEYVEKVKYRLLPKIW